MGDVVPDRPTLRPFVLASLYNNDGECSKQQIAEEVAEAFQLTERARNEATTAGRNKLLNQIDWVTGKDLGVLDLLIDHGERVTLTDLGERVIELFHEDTGWEIEAIRRRIAEVRRRGR